MWDPREVTVERLVTGPVDGICAHGVVEALSLPATRVLTLETLDKQRLSLLIGGSFVNGGRCMHAVEASSV